MIPKTTMLKFFFNRFSWVARFAEGLGVIGTYFFLQLFHWGELTLTEGLFLLVVAQYLFIRTCDLIAWYPHEGRQLGIEVHFKKVVVVASYGLALAAWSCLFGFKLPTLIFTNLVLLFISFVNGTQIWFHFHDEEELPINYFTQNRHLAY
ncbi:MAG: hypothetical protein Q7S00_08130 [bacterium]|nr:hypothetical protein [bacterium]